MKFQVLFATVLALAFNVPALMAKKEKAADPDECQVCIEVLDSVDSMLDKKEKSSQVSIEEALGKYCGGKELSQKQKKMCYYLDPIKKSVSQPFSLKLPKLKVCQRLKKTNPEICDVKNAVKVEQAASSEDIKKLRVKQLKRILNDRGVECEGCLEKEDYVKRVLETAHMDL